MATWPCPHCGTVGEIDTEGPYYQAGGRSIRCAGCGGFFEYGVVSTIPPAEPADTREAPLCRPPRARPVTGPKELSTAERRKASGIALLISVGLFGANFAMLALGGSYFPILFAISPFLFTLGTFGLVIPDSDAKSRATPWEGCLGCAGILALGLSLVGGFTFAFFPVEILQWLGLARR